VRERVPQAQAAVQAVAAALTALRAAHHEWTSIEAESMRLLRLAGQRTDIQPRLPAALAALVRDARRIEVDVPLPLPTAMRVAVATAEPVGSRS
jgi:hypothetical protein